MKCWWCQRKRKPSELEPITSGDTLPQRQCKDYKSCDKVYHTIPVEQRNGSPW